MQFVVVLHLNVIAINCFGYYANLFVFRSFVLFNIFIINSALLGLLFGKIKNSHHTNYISKTS